MRVRLRAAWQRLRGSFWFLPVLLIAAAAVVAELAVGFDASGASDALRDADWIYGGDPRGASTLLGAIASSMVTIAGVVFSLTLVALSLASSQFGPRLLRNFMRDTVNQSVLGIFVATFLYCLLVLRAVRHEPPDTFVPHLSVTLGVALAVASLIVLIYFVHHVAVSIQAEELVSRVSGELDAAIDRLFPAELGASGEPERASDLPDGFEREAVRVPAPCDGYVELVESGTLFDLACRHDLVLNLERGPGDYVSAGDSLVRVWRSQPADDELIRSIAAQFVLGSRRTPQQDVEHGAQQLAEIALRALSPGVNDPFTAIVCIDRLGSSLGRLAGRAIPSPHRVDAGGALRVVAPPASFESVLGATFSPLRSSVASHPSILVHLLRTLAAIADRVQRGADAGALRAQVEWIGRRGAELPDEDDRRMLAFECDQAQRHVGRALARSERSRRESG